MPDFRVAKDEVHGGQMVGDVRRRENAARLHAFRSTVWRYWKKEGRHDLPWRKTKDPYRVRISDGKSTCKSPSFGRAQSVERARLQPPCKISARCCKNPHQKQSTF